MQHKLPVPLPLRIALQTANTHLRRNSADDIYVADLIAISTLFGSLHTIKHSFTPQHQRRLLLYMLTLRHLLPIWEYLLPDNTDLQEQIDVLIALIMRRLPNNQAEQALEQLWNVIETMPQTPKTIEYIGISVYTFTKIIDQLVYPHSIYDDYAPDTHAHVALVYLAKAHTALDTRSKDTASPLFWRYWFNEIVPRAWFEIAAQP